MMDENEWTECVKCGKTVFGVFGEAVCAACRK